MAQQLYVPCMPLCTYVEVEVDCNEIPVGSACYTFPGYIDQGDWHNTPKQRALMLSYPETSIVQEHNRLSHGTQRQQTREANPKSAGS